MPDEDILPSWRIFRNWGGSTAFLGIVKARTKESAIPGEWSEAPACTQRTGACFHAALGGWGAEGGAALLGAYMGRRGACAR